MEYVLARKQQDAMVFFCGDDPQSAKTGFDMERAKRFESPGDAMEFRSRMDARSQYKFIVHELDGSLLQSLDV
jgi:hypothetical protein